MITISAGKLQKLVDQVAANDKEIEELKASKENLVKIAEQFQENATGITKECFNLKKQITDLKAEIERLKGKSTKERIMNAVHKSLQWEDGEILGIDILTLEEKISGILNTNDH